MDLIYKLNEEWILVDFKSAKENSEYKNQIDLETLGFKIKEARLEYL